MKDPTSLLRQVSLTFLTKVAGAVIQLCVSVLVARSLGPEGRGAFAAAMALAAIGIQFGNLGVPTSNTFFLARQPDLLPTLIGNSLAVAAAFGFVVCVALGVFAYGIGMLRQMDWVLIALALAWVPAGLAYAFLHNLLLGAMAVERFNQIDIGLKALTLLFAAIVAYAHLATATGYFVAALGAQLLAVAAVYLCLRRLGSAPVTASVQLLRRQIPFAFRSYLALLFGFLLIRSDLLMVQHISGNEETGYYSTAVSMADMILMLPTALGTILFPALSGTGEGSSRWAKTRRALLHLSWSLSALSIVACILAGPAVTLLFGPKFEAAVPVFYVLAAAVTVLGLNTVLSVHLAAEGFPWSGVWVWVVALGVNLVLNLSWIPTYGGKGAAYASLVAYVVAFLVQVGIVARMKEGDGAQGLA